MLTLLKARTVYGDTVYLDADEYADKAGTGRLLKAYNADGSRKLDYWGRARTPENGAHAHVHPENLLTIGGAQ